MKALIRLILLHVFIFGLNQQTSAQEITDTGLIPERIMLTIPANPATTRAVTWRTTNTKAKTIGQIAKAQATPLFENDVLSVSGTSAFWEDDNNSALGHRIIFDNLQANTLYSYRVGDGENWSEWFQFTTSSSENKPFNFLYLGDFQNDIKSLCSRTIRQAYLHFPEAEFILFAGDIVSRSTEDYWSEFFYAGNWIFGTIPTLATPGNHEYDKYGENQPRTFSKHWNQIFTNPDNHPKNLKGRTYFMDYQGVRFISLDSPAMGNNKEDAQNTIEWLHKTLSENQNKWTILFTHYPIYSCSQGRNNEEYRNALKPILEKYGVDLVLQGHDHTYCRGQNLGNVASDCKNPPMYVVSVAGPKMYGLNVNKWSDRVGSQLQLYQNIKVNENTLEMDVFTVTGELYDRFILKKNKKGINRIIESSIVKNLTENVEIPESAKLKYTEDEISIYKKVMK